MSSLHLHLDIGSVLCASGHMVEEPLSTAIGDFPKRGILVRFIFLWVV